MALMNNYWWMPVIVFLIGFGLFMPLEAPLLPDLRTLPPSDLNVVTTDGGRRKAVRFSNMVWNAGPGDLVMKGAFNAADQTAAVDQVVAKTDGTEENHPVGDLIFHPAHNHWHWNGFSLYEIVAVEPGGTLGKVAASSEKVSYCIRDDQRAPGEEGDLGSKHPAKFTVCGWKQQGLSVGWTDVYDQYTPGQIIDITGLPDGFYALRSTSNPDGILLETNPQNNTAVTFFRLRGKDLDVLDVVRTHTDRFYRNGEDRGFQMEE